MSNPRRSRATVVIARGVLVVFAIGLTVTFAAPAARAHVPHDVISSVAFSPQYASDQTVFTLSRGHVLRSVDSGANWTESLRGIGPEALNQIVIAASDKTRMYLASVGGIYRSTDSATSWTFFFVRGGISHVAVSPTNPNLVLATGTDSGLYRSTDGGQTWATVAGDFGRITSLTFEPGASRQLLGTDSGRIYLSVDSGSTWTTKFVVPDGSAVTALGTRSTVPANETVAGTASGELFRSIDDGNSFVPYGSGIPKEQVLGIAVSPGYATDHTVWVSTWTSGVYRSTNYGLTWTQTASGLTTDEQAVQYDVPEFSALAAAPDQGGQPVLFVAGFDGLFRSDDGGTTWHERQTLSEYITSLAISPDFAHDHTVAVDTYVKGAYLSTDNGSSFHWADNGIGTGANKFAPIRRLFGVEFSPDYANDKTIFSATWPYLLKTTDRGESWTQIRVPVAAGEEALARLFVVAVSPNYRNDQTVFVGTKTGAFFRSTDGGSTWTLLAQLGSEVRSIVISKTFATDGVVYVGAVAGIFNSTDRGVSWTKSGPSNTTPQLAMSPDYANDGTVFAGTSQGLWVTRDRGQTWNVLTGAPLTATNDVDAIAVSPAYADDHTILVSVQRQGLYRSTDGGNTFVAVATALYADNHAILDFENPVSAPIQFSPDYAADQTVYAFGGMDLMRSTDGGVTWAIVPLPTGAEFLAPPSIANVTRTSVLEGSAGHSVLLRVPFDLSHPSAQTITVQWHTVDGSTEPYASSATGDFVATSGTLVYPPGTTRQDAVVKVLGDDLVEPDELVAIATSNPTNATLGGYFGLGLGGIRNDDS